MAKDTQNVISQIRRIITLEDPYQGLTEEQNRAYYDLERLSCDNMKDIFQYMNDYKVLAANSGRMFISPELSEKFFRKMPSLIGKEIEEAFNKKYPGTTIAVIPRIHFAYQYLAELRNKAALQEAVKDLSFYSKIPIPGYYDRRPGRKYGLRKANNYKGKPHPSHVRIFKRKYGDRVKKCKCYICGEEGHFARECKKKTGNIARAAVMGNLSLPEDWDVVSVDMGESDSDAICSISEGEADSQPAVMTEELPYETAVVLTEEKDYGWRKKVTLVEYQQLCEHVFQVNQQIENSNYITCVYCKIITSERMRIHCPKCNLTSCLLCAKFYLGEVHSPRPKPPASYTSKDQLIVELIKYTDFLLEENMRLEKALTEVTLQDYRELEPKAPEPSTMGRNRGKLIIHDDEDEQAEEANVLQGYNVSEQSKPARNSLNHLFYFEVKFTIHGGPSFSLRAILDTGATTCCADINAIPVEALELCKMPVRFHRINTVSIAKKRIKEGYMDIGNSRFRTPFIFCSEMSMKDGIQMLLGCNFIRAMRGGLLIEGNDITFYKNVTAINTSAECKTAKIAIPELELEADEYRLIQEMALFSGALSLK